MNKRLHVIIWVTLFIMMIALNVYNYKKSSKISQYVEESNSHTESIVLIDRFRTDISIMSQSQKLYLLTEKQEYKTKYEQDIANVYKTIDEMEVSGSISSDEKDELVKIVDEYSRLTLSTTNTEKSSSISDESEQKIIKSNEVQLSILEQLDKSVDGTKETLTEKNNTIASTSEKQKGIIQTISTVLTGLGSSIIYYIKKNPSKVGKNVENIIECISKDEENEEVNINKYENSEIENKVSNKEKESVKDYIDYIVQYEKMIQGNILVYNQSIKIKDRLSKTDDIVNQIYICLKQLRVKIEESENCSPGIKSSLLRDIEDQFVELRILFETLPNYNEIIADISRNIINSKDGK